MDGTIGSTYSTGRCHQGMHGPDGAVIKKIANRCMCMHVISVHEKSHVSVVCQRERVRDADALADTRHGRQAHASHHGVADPVAGRSGGRPEVLRLPGHECAVLEEADGKEPR